MHRVVNSFCEFRGSRKIAQALANLAKEGGGEGTNALPEAWTSW